MPLSLLLYYVIKEQQWRDKEPGDRRLNFVPKKYNNLRSVPGYNRFVNERFERCLDLYMCPRQIKMRVCDFVLFLNIVRNNSNKYFF